MEKSVERFLELAKDLDADLIEVRADGLEKCTPEEVHRLVSELKKNTNSSIILTVRKKSEGGSFNGSEEERKTVLLGSLHLADMIDIELNSSIRDEVVQKAKANKIGVIISHHDFDKTPWEGEMKAIVKEEMEAGADYVKIAFYAGKADDVLRLLSFTLNASKVTKIISVSMGEKGKISRVASPVFGSAISYTSIGRETGPGQLSLAETKKVFEMLGL
jgi:3-dehydroquinate dehydratase-1